MKSFIKILLLLLPLVANAQTDAKWGYITRQQADSLKSTLSIEKNDTLLMAAYRSLGFYYGETNLDSSTYYHQYQLGLAKKLNLKIWMADAYSQLGGNYSVKGADITRAYEALSEAENIAGDEENENSNWHPRTFSNAQNFHDSRLAVIAINNIALAGFYNEVNEKGKGLETLQEVVRIGDSINNGKIISLAYMNMANMYNNDSTILFCRKAIMYSEKAGYRKFIGTMLGNMARGFFLTNHTDSAKKYILASLAVNLAENNKRASVFSYYGLSVMSNITHQKDSSIYYARKALLVAQSIGYLEVTGPLKQMADVFHSLNMPDSAYKYQNLYSNLKDSLTGVRINELTDYQKKAFNEQLRLKKLNDDKTAAENKLKLYILLGGLVAVVIIAFVLYRNNRQKQETNKVLETTLNNLKSTQSQLIQSEKMASLGELTAGIAHEIQNPLNFVNNFSEVSNELMDEMKDELLKGNYEDVNAIADDVKQNLEKINHHGKRADAIVRGMLQHSRQTKGVKELTDINALCDEYLRLSFHGLRAKDKSFNADYKTDFDESIGNINIVPQDIGRVLLNILTNAFYAVSKPPASKGEQYKPLVTVSTKKIIPLQGLGAAKNSPSGVGGIEIRVTDNGNGIPSNIKEKIFQPFFTTKPTGQGTGLGLSLAYDIITKQHNGTIKVESPPAGEEGKQGEGSVFIINLPV